MLCGWRPRGGSSTHGARQAWARSVPSCPPCVPDRCGTDSAFPLALTTAPSSQHTPAPAASLPGTEPKRSWELGQACVIRNKKIPTNNTVLGFEHEMPLAFPVIHVGTVTTVLAFSKKQGQRDSFLSTTKLLAEKGRKEQQLCLCADPSPQQGTCRAPAWEPADPPGDQHQQHQGLPVRSLVQKAP